MPYYPTIDEDLTRAKEILAKGKRDISLVQNMGGEAVYGSDIYAAYKLLESFVQHIEHLQDVILVLVAQQAPAIKLNHKAAERIRELETQLQQLQRATGDLP